MTVKERYEPAHECTCSGPMRPSNGDSDEETYRIECEFADRCRICGFGRCLLDSKFSRMFTAERKSDGSFGTTRTDESHCFTFKAPEDAGATTSCT